MPTRPIQNGVHWQEEGPPGRARKKAKKRSRSVAAIRCSGAATRPCRLMRSLPRGTNHSRGKHIKGIVLNALRASHRRPSEGRAASGRTADSPGSAPDTRQNRITDPIRSGGVSALTEELERDADYNDLDELLRSEPDTAATDMPDEQKDDRDIQKLDMGLIVNTEDISDLDDEEETTAAKQLTTYIFPPFDLLVQETKPKEADYSEELRENAKKLMDTLNSFNVRIRILPTRRGPTITRDMSSDPTPASECA